MLRFGGKRPSRNYLGRREQFRLFTLFGMLALVVVLMKLAGRPESWNWFNVLAPQPKAAATLAQDGPIDTLQPDENISAEVPDAMRIAPAVTPPEDGDRESLPGLRRDAFAGVADDTVLRGGDEHEAFFQTLEVLQGIDEQSATLPRPIDVGFVQLFRQPQAYRGDWIRVSGVVRRALPISVPKNAHGVQELHQLWLQPEGRPDDLLAVDVLQLPPGFPTGTAVKAPVTIDGVFFKRWAYHAGDGIRTSPLILARTVVWTPEAAPLATARSISPSEIAIAALVVAATVGLAMWFIWGGHQRRTELKATTDFRELAARDRGNDVHRMLADLQHSDQDAAAQESDS